jgi:hypothetical protein
MPLPCKAKIIIFVRQISNFTRLLILQLQPVKPGDIIDINAQTAIF